MPSRHHSQKRRSSSPPALEKRRHGSTSERHHSGSQRYENDSRRPSRRSPSPPMAFRRDSSAYAARSSSFRARGYISSRSRAFSVRGGRSMALTRFSTRSRFSRIPFHGHHSSTRELDRRSTSPSGLHSYSSSQAWDRGRPFRGATRAARRADFIGSFGRPIYYQPEYEVSPDRTTEDKLPAEPEEVVEDRDELFSKMMEAKRSEKLDDYYRLRDLLNAFDRRNPHLAFRGSGRIASTRRKLTESPERNGSEKRSRIDNDNQRKTNNRGAVLGEELEEVDCTETAQVKLECIEEDLFKENNEKYPKINIKNKESKINCKIDKNDITGGSKVKKEVAVEMEQISNEDHDNYQNDDFDYDDKNGNRDDIYCGDLYEEENAVDLDFMEDEIVDEEITSSERLKSIQFREKQKQNIKQESPLFQMFRPEFLPILISSLRKGVVIVNSTKESNSNKQNTPIESDVVKSHGEPELIDSNSGKKRGRKSKKNKVQEILPIKTSSNKSEQPINSKNDIIIEELQLKETSHNQIPTLLEISLCCVITSEMNSSKKL